jgi:hypothetical protein
VFWHHDLERKLSVTVDPMTGEAGGRLVEFIEALSAHHLPEERRTRAAIAGFVKRNRRRAMNDPDFGPMRFMAV